MTEAQFEALSKRVDVLTRLAAMSLVADKEPLDQFILLSRAGFQPKEIGEIVGTTANTVRVALSRHRKKTGKM